MKPIEIKGKQGRDRLIIWTGKRNIYITAMVDDIGADFRVPRSLIKE